MCKRLFDEMDGPPRAWALGLALGVLFVVVLLPTSWHSNEEDYFALAYRRVAPAAFSPYSAVFDHANARIVFEYLLGSIIRFVGYGPAHIVARLAMAGAYAAGFAVFFKAFGLSMLDAAAVVAVFCLAGQQLIGGEWLFAGVESKTAAYAAVAAALGFAWTCHWQKAVVLAAIATYLHFLVGGFWGAVVVLVVYLHTRRLSAALRACGLYVALILPLAGVLVSDRIVPAGVVLPGNLNEIYALRVAFHVLPFVTRGEFWSWTPGIVATGALAAGFWLVSGRRDGRLTEFVLLLLSYSLCALVVSFFDRSSYFVAPLYLFRPSSLTLFIAITALFVLVREEVPSPQLTLIRQAGLGVLIVVFVWSAAKTRMTEIYLGGNRQFAQLAELTAAIEHGSTSDEIVLIEPEAGGLFEEADFPDVALPRLLPRPTLVSYKFIPTAPLDLARWATLVDFRRRVFRNGCSAPLLYPVRLLLVRNRETLAAVQNCGPILWQGRDGTLVRVDDRWLALSPRS